jgi:hypothetical protein
MDFSKLSNEELQKLIVNSEEHHAVTSQQEEPGFLKSALQGYGNYAKGVVHGAGQSIGDLAASAINWPISGIEKLTNHKIPHAPHPDLLNKNPGGLSESIGQTLGEIGGGFALPGGAGLKAVQLANKGYQALRGARELPLIGKLLAGSAGGALEGAAGNEKNRGQGAKLGAAFGTAGYAIPSTINFARTLSSKNIAKNIQNEVANLGKHFSDVFTSHLNEGEKAGANAFLKPEKANIKILKKAGEGKLAYGIEKFNENPTLTNAHKAQSDLNKIVNKYSKSKEGSLENDVYDESLKLKNRLLKKISESFEKANVKEHGAGYQQARIDFAKEMAPYKESPAINALLGKNKRGVQTLRPGKFADTLLKEEEFLTQAAKNKKHPELFRREKFNKLKESKLAQNAALGAGAVTAGFLPYAVAKALGLK